MTRKTPLCRSCGMPMKGHSKSGCPTSNSPQQKDDVSMISSTPSFFIPETGPFRRQNPNYIPPPDPPQMEPLVLSSASLTTTEPVCSVNIMQRRSFPPLQQFTPNWSRPSSPQPNHRIPKQQSSFLFESASAPLFPASVLNVEPEDDVRLVAGIYQVPTMTVESIRSRALSNGVYCVPVKPLQEENDVDSTWVVTGPDINDVDALVSILQPRESRSQMRLTAIMRMARDVNGLYYGLAALALLLFCAFKQ